MTKILGGDSFIHKKQKQKMTSKSIEGRRATPRGCDNDDVEDDDDDEKKKEKLFMKT